MTVSVIEKNKLENIDSLQIEYLSDVPISKKDIVVMESSAPIAITIRKFLADLGFENIFVCENPADGIKIFSDFINNEINIPIIIDSSILNGSIKNIVNDIFEIQVSANIIIITTKEKDDIQIRELFNMGVISIIHKPINFEELKNSLSGILEKKSDIKIEDEKKIELLLSSYNKVSVNKIHDTLKMEYSKIEALIKKLMDQRILLPDKEVLEAACNMCNSVNISYEAECPQCKGINFRQQNLIEHYRCGEVYPKEMNYTTCPKCNKEIGSVGTDYREFSDFYVCNSCNDRFPKPLFKFVCLECGNFFIEKLAAWKKSKLYQIHR
jgi:DNA-binding response OmpR family regulator